MLSLHRIVGRSWAIRGEIADLVQRSYRQDGITEIRALAGLRGQVYGRAKSGRQVGGSVAVVPILGMLTQRGDLVNSAETVSTTAVGDDIRDLAADESVSAIVLEMDSPGGEVYGVPEAAARVRGARASKPVLAVANSLAASAMYWIGSQADELIVTPSGEVGSIGVFALHEDVSEALAAEGVKVTLISAGKYKTEGNPYEPLTDEARATTQQGVDRFYDMFVRDVAKGRRVEISVVRDGFGEGRVVGAREAVRLGMADGIGTLEDGIRRAVAMAQDRRSPRAAVDVPIVVAAAPAESPAAYGEVQRRRHELWGIDNPIHKV